MQQWYPYPQQSQPVTVGHICINDTLQDLICLRCLTDANHSKLEHLDKFEIQTYHILRHRTQFKFYFELSVGIASVA